MIDKLPKKKQHLLLLYLLIMFIALFYISTLDRYDTIQYKDIQGNVICEENYVNGKIINGYCPQNTRNIFNVGGFNYTFNIEND